MFVALCVRERSAFACWSRGAHEGGRGGSEESAGRARERLQQCELPDPRDAAEQEHGGGRLCPEAHEVRSEHHRAAREPVGPHAPGEEERGTADRVRGEDDAEAACSAADPQHRERERDRDQRVAEHRGGPSQPEQPKRAFRQRPEAPTLAHGRSLCLRGTTMGARNRGFRLSSWT